MLRYTAIAEEPENEGNAGERRKNEQTSHAANSGTRDEKRQSSSKSDNSDAKRLSAKSARLSTSAFNEDTMDESGSDRFSLTDEDDEFFTEDEESSELSKSFKKEKRKESKPKENKKVKSTTEEDEEELLKAGILNANQIREIKEAFHVFDVNGDGCITATELKKLVTSLGYNITEAELMDMMNQIDSDGNGAIDFPEFLSLMTKNLDDYDPEDILQESFKVFDRDNSGFIGVSELDRVFRLLGQDFKDYEIEAMIKAADADGDGLVSYDDFVKMMNV